MGVAVSESEKATLLFLWIMLELQKNSRQSNTEIAKKLGFSEATVRKRIQKMIKSRTISRFTIEVSTKTAFTAFTLISTEPQKKSGKLVEELARISGVKRIFELAGKTDYMAEINSANAEAFNDVIDRIRQTAGISNTESLVVLRIH